MVQDAWVTGANGFIGRHLVRHLVRCGVPVSGLGHGSASDELGRIGIQGWINGTVTFSNLQLLQNMRRTPEVIFHLAGGSSVGAAVANPKEDFERTVASTIELYEWVRQHAPLTRVVLISSAAVYGSGHQSPIAVGAALSPYSPYGFHKSMMEALAHSYGASYGVQSVIARLFSVYGAGLKKQLLWDLCVKLSAPRVAQVTLGGSGKEVRDFIHVEDVVSQLHDIVHMAAPECPTMNMGCGQPLTVEEIAKLVVSAWGTEPAATVAFNGQRRPGDPFYLVADRGGQGVSGPAPTEFARGVLAYVGWARSILLGRSA